MYINKICLCLQASLAKEESSQGTQDTVAVDKVEEEAIVIRDAEDDSTLDDNSDNESVVEVLEEPEIAESEPLEVNNICN